MLLRDVELGLALHGCRLLGESSHKLVEVSLEFLLDTIGPLLLGVQLRNEVIGHLGEQVIKWVIVDLAGDNLLIDAVHENWFLTSTFNEKRDLVLLSRNI